MNHNISLSRVVTPSPVCAGDTTQLRPPANRRLKRIRCLTKYKPAAFGQPVARSAQALMMSLLKTIESTVQCSSFIRQMTFKYKCLYKVTYCILFISLLNLSSLHSQIKYTAVLAHYWTQCYVRASRNA